MDLQAVQTILLVVQVFVALTLIGFILIQHGKGADAGAAFGSGASGTVFGSRGSSNFLTKTTTILAIVFLLNSLALAYLATQREAPTSLMEDTQLVEETQKQETMGELADMMEKAGEQAEAEVAEGTKMDNNSDIPDWTPEAPSDIPALPSK